MPSRAQISGPRGATLTDWIMAIFIVGIAVGLMVPWLDHTGGVSRREQCRSHLRNVELAILGYVNAHNAFPPSGVFAEDEITLQNLARGNTDPSASVVPTYFPGAKGEPRGVPMSSWVVPVLPWLDNQELFDQWTMQAGGSAVSYLDSTQRGEGQASNNRIAETAIGVLRCPDDETVLHNRGNLSYVVNGGFALWHADPVGWVGGAIDGAPAPTARPLAWSTTPSDWTKTVDVTRRLGVMFIETKFPEGIGQNVTIPWNVRSTHADISDGQSWTLLLSENTLTGASAEPTFYSRGLPTNWATPLPNFTSFFGPSNVCGDGSFPASLDCATGGLGSNGGVDGPGWAFANKEGTYTNINFGQNLTIEGSFPFPNSPHPGGFSAGFCDGAVRFIRSTIDGTVYAKLITPAGEKLPIHCRQLPLDAIEFGD